MLKAPKTQKRLRYVPFACDGIYRVCHREHSTETHSPWPNGQCLTEETMYYSVVALSPNEPFSQEAINFINGT